MDHAITADSASRFEAYVEGTCERNRPCGPCPAVTGLLRWPDDAMRAQERRAYGGGDRT
jgi:hypothetical protein